MKNLSPEQLEKRKKTNKKIIKYFLFPVILFWVIILLIPSDDKKNNKSTEKVENSIQTIQNWEYGESDKDKLDNTTYKYSSCSSKNKVELKFPYSGGSTVEIFLRNGFKKNGNEVILEVDKGQFMSSYDGNKKIRMKFDENPPTEYSFLNEGTGQSTTIFLDHSNSIIEKLKKSKKLIIEVEFYNNGTSQFEFDVDGLKWDYK